MRKQAMKKNIQLLDCTLREAPVEDFYVGERLMKAFIRGCEDVGIDIIECGFLKNVEYRFGGNCFKTVDQFIHVIKNKKPDTMYVALMDCGRFDVEKLADYDGKSIDGVRICFKYGQQMEAIKEAKIIKNKGYKVFIQHVDTLAYSDIEIIEFLGKVNEIEPYAYAIVDTFGSMYEDDMRRISMLVNYHLKEGITLGFHAHNNLMLANSNAQSFISEFAGKRHLIVDVSMLGCGRGAGNANTEILAAYLNKKYYSQYGLNEILDLIDNLMPSFQKKCTWGYSIPYFLSGLHSTHVYNANHLLRRHNIALKDLRAIIEKLDNRQKKSYDYTLLEKIYVEYFSHPINDSYARTELSNDLEGKKILLLSSGKTLQTEKEKIDFFIQNEHPIVIGVNGGKYTYGLDYLFFSNNKRYDNYLINNVHDIHKMIITSNIVPKSNKDEYIIVDYESLIKYGWINIDSAMILVLRLLIGIGCNDIYMAGFDGFSSKQNDNYYTEELVTDMKEEDLLLLTKENREMLVDILNTHPRIKIHFITSSLYENMEVK
jgi:4-hydroxy 2-oxovalerate aldolase